MELSTAVVHSTQRLPFEAGALKTWTPPEFWTPREPPPALVTTRLQFCVPEAYVFDAHSAAAAFWPAFANLGIEYSTRLQSCT